MSSSNFLPGRFSGPEANAKDRNFHYNTFFKFCQAKYRTKISLQNFPKLCTLPSPLHHAKSLNRYYFTSLNHYRATSPRPHPPPLPLSPLLTSPHLRICAHHANKSTYPLSCHPSTSPYICAQYLNKIARFSLSFSHFSLDFQKIFCYNIKKNHFFYRLGAFSGLL